ncbi:MAG: DNA cytosine methyltransferase [Chitinispirillales bacterium]|nr:DNA cytosine methyltransferase [Chitinispirillales bacterium]
MPRWWDIHTLTKESFYERTGLRTVDVISGGFPCQPFSVAGLQKGKSDGRYLWPEMLRVIRELAPRWVVAENVSGILRIAGDDVCASLHDIGYEVGVFCYEAAAVGAPHRRARVFFVGNAVRGRLSRGLGWWTGKISTDGCQNVSHADVAKIDQQLREPGRSYRQPRQPVGTGQEAARPADGVTRFCAAHVADTDCQRKSQPQSCERNIGGRIGDSREDVAYTNNPAPARFGEHSGEVYAGAETKGFDVRGSADWWAVEPDVGRVAYGVPNRMDRLKCLGNAVVPQQIFPIFAAIAAIERVTHENVNE